MAHAPPFWQPISALMDSLFFLFISFHFLWVWKIFWPGKASVLSRFIEMIPSIGPSFPFLIFQLSMVRFSHTHTHAHIYIFFTRAWYGKFQWIHLGCIQCWNDFFSLWYRCLNNWGLSEQRVQRIGKTFTTGESIIVECFSENKSMAWNISKQNQQKKMKWNWTVRMITLVEINDTFVSGNIKPISGTVGSAAKPSVGWRINPFFSTSFTRAWYGKLQKSGMTYFHSSTFTHSPGIAVWRHLSHSGNAWGKRNKLRNWWIYECYQCFLQEHDTESSKTRNWNV